MRKALNTNELAEAKRLYQDENLTVRAGARQMGISIGRFHWCLVVGNVCRRSRGKAKQIEKPQDLLTK